MDFWVVAAATGAGYVAKHWQNLSGEKDGSSKSAPMPSPRLQPDPCRVFSTVPNSVFSSPVSGPAPIFIDKQVLQDDTDEMNEKPDYFDTSGPGHRLHEFRTNITNGKSFSSLRPLLVVTSNGRDSERKRTAQRDDVKDHKIVFMDEIGASMEASFFEPNGSVKLPKRSKQMYVKRFETGNDIVPLFLGITIGILSTTVSNQHEVEHLNELLEEAESMVRDLHNKLETKDGITIKEHGTGAIETATDSPKADNFELTSDIEAELEAELGRLEQNMSNVDSDIEKYMARGDLNLDAVGWQLDSRSESDHGDKSESTARPIFTPNYAVSPLDLQLRLHEVIESELRARIEELEAILENQNNQRKHHSPEPQEENSFWDFDHTRIESSSSTP